MHKKSKFTEPELSVEDLSRSLYEVNKKLDKTIRERDEIFANISHDLRSPITAIHNSIEYLQSLDHIADEDLAQTLPLLYDRTIVLEKMINEIFLLTKLDSSDTLLHFYTVPVADYLEDYYYSLDADSQYDTRDLHLDLSAISGQLCFSVDPDYLKRVFDNLFANALRYTSAGDQITLSAVYVPNGLHLSSPSVVITVADSGVGISPEDLPRIFERTYTVSHSRTPSDKSGAGLGLAICQSILQKHNGTIWCTSDGNHHGCQFLMELPVEN